MSKYLSESGLSYFWNSIKTALNLKADKTELISCTDYTATIPSSGWVTSNGISTQSVSVTGIQATDKPIVDIDMSSADTATYSAILSVWSRIHRITAGANSITAYCYGDPPMLTDPDITIQLKVIR